MSRALVAEPAAPVETGLRTGEADVADDGVVRRALDGVTGIDRVAGDVDRPALLANPRRSSPAIRASSSTTRSFTARPPGRSGGTASQVAQLARAGTGGQPSDTGDDPDSDRDHEREQDDKIGPRDRGAAGGGSKIPVSTLTNR